MAKKAVILGVFALVYTTLAVVSYVQKSATRDEPMHLTAGYVALVEGDHRVDPSHPPSCGCGLRCRCSCSRVP